MARAPPHLDYLQQIHNKYALRRRVQGPHQVSQLWGTSPIGFPGLPSQTGDKRAACVDPPHRAREVREGGTSSNCSQKGRRGNDGLNEGCLDGRGIGFRNLGIRRRSLRVQQPSVKSTKSFKIYSRIPAEFRLSAN